jgi:hypothetical protein
MEALAPLVPWFGMLICAGLGWWMNDLYQAHKSLRVDVAQLREQIPQLYVSKADFKDDLDEIKQTLRDIFQALRHQQPNS